MADDTAPDKKTTILFSPQQAKSIGYRKQINANELTVSDMEPDTMAVIHIAIISILPSTSLFPVALLLCTKATQADSGLLFMSLLRDALRNLFAVVMLPKYVAAVLWLQRGALFLSANGNLSVNKLFQ